MLLRRILHIICSLWLAVLLIFGTTPKEAVHLLAGHQDTVHIKHSSTSYLEKVHHHCAFLELALSPFAADAFEITYRYYEPLVFTWYNLSVKDRRCTNLLHTALRGPPAFA